MVTKLCIYSAPLEEKWCCNATHTFMVSIAPFVPNSPSWSYFPLSPSCHLSGLAVIAVFPALTPVVRETTLGKYVGQTSISIPEIIRKISITEYLNELSATVNKNNFQVQTQSKTNEQITSLKFQGYLERWSILLCIPLSLYLNHLVTTRVIYKGEFVG